MEGSAADDHVIDRRDMLVGLGGELSGATSITNEAIAEKSHGAISKADTGNDEAVKCCDMFKGVSNFKDFQKLGRTEPKRVRKPAHKYTSDDVAKFERAIKLMKDLPADDPRNFWHIGKIDSTFCDLAINHQPGTDKAQLLQIHRSWFFLPWHRMYIYFWERILGSLIGDPTFAIPYWNWDVADGMYMPEMYWKNEDSPLFDGTRDKNRYRTIMDGDKNPCAQAEFIAMRNQCGFNRDFTEAESEPSHFMGGPIRAGQDAQITSESGCCELIHNMAHSWAGPSDTAHHNVGKFVTSGTDPIFFAHHANVDRIWDTYTKSRENRPEFRDRDWLDSTFNFIDENKDIVKCRVRDFLRVEQLGYSYGDAEEQSRMEMDKKCN